MSKWDKLLYRIRSLSSDLRFDELKKVLEEYGYIMNSPKVEVVIIHIEKRVVGLSLFQSIKQ